MVFCSSVPRFFSVDTDEIEEDAISGSKGFPSAKETKESISIDIFGSFRTRLAGTMVIQE